MRRGRIRSTNVDSAGSGISTGESGAANLHLRYAVYLAVDSAGSGISAGEPGAANLHLRRRSSAVYQGRMFVRNCCRMHVMAVCASASSRRLSRERHIGWRAGSCKYAPTTAVVGGLSSKRHDGLREFFLLLYSTSVTRHLYRYLLT